MSSLPPTVTGPSLIYVGTRTYFTFTGISATDPDGVVLAYTFYDSSSSGFFLYHGIEYQNQVSVSATDLSNLSYYSGVFVGSEAIAVYAIDDSSTLSVNPLVIDLEVLQGSANKAPLITGPSVIYRSDDSTFDFTSVISATDADGWVAQYRFTDAVAGAGYLQVGGVKISDASVTVTAANLKNVTYYTGANWGQSNDIRIEAIDGEGLVSNPFNLTIDINLQPVITGPSSLNKNTLSSFKFDSLISATDDSAVVSYRFTDVSGEGYLTLNGNPITDTPYTVSAANLDQVGFYTGNAGGTNSITIEAIDDLGVSSIPLQMQINVANQAPTINGPTSLNKSLSQNFDLTSLFTASDPDGTVAFWNFRDATPGPQAYLTLNGAQVDSAGVSASYLGIAPFGNIGYYTGTSSGTNTIEVWATDNAGLSSTRKQVTITTGPNTAPTITGPASVNMGLDDWFNFAPLITATDVDGEVAQYRFTDTDTGGGQLTYDGKVVSGTSITVLAADLALVGYLSGLTAGSNTIAIEAIDNVNAVSPLVLIMKINAQANQAPTLSGPSSFTMGTNVSFDETDALFTSLLTAADSDGTVALYVFTDSTPGAGYLTLNGAPRTSITVVAADLGQVGYTAGSFAGSNSITIEAIDNLGLGTTRTMTIIVGGDGGAANQAPTISGPASVSKGINESFKFGTVSASGVVVLSALDADGSVAQYRFWDSMPGAGYLTRFGDPIDGTSVTVSAAELGQVGYDTGASAGSNSIVIEAIDNMGLASPIFLTMAINVTGAGGMANQAPTITGPATVSKLTNELFKFTSLISADDADGNVAQYRFTDSMPGAGYLLDGGREAAAVFTVSAANLGEVSYNTGAFAGSNTIAIEAIDNLGLASPRVLTMTIIVQGTAVTPGTGGSGGTANQAPTISGPASISKNTNEFFDFTSLISGSDADADGWVAHYRFWDSTPGAGYLTLKGEEKHGDFTVAAADLSQVGYSTGAVAGSNVIAIEAIDNLGRASPGVLTTTIIVAGTAVTPVTPGTGGTGATANQAPTISGPASISKSTNEFFDFTSLISGSDADGSVAQYRFWDSTSGAGYLTLNGAAAPSVFTVAASNLWQVGYSTGAVAGSNVIAIEAIDNLGRASPSVLTTTIIVNGPAATGATGSEANRAPTISGPTNVSKSINQSFDFTSLVSASDADGSVAEYRFSDNVSGAGYLTLNGVQLSGTSVTVSAANLAQVGYYTGASVGSNTIAIEAIDNLGLASPRFLMMAINVSANIANSATTVTTGATVPLADLGHDMALYQGRVAGYTVAATATGYNVTIKSGAFPTDTLQNVDWVLFDDLAPYGDGSSAVVNRVARTIDGGAGIDTLAIHGSSSQYTITHTATGFTIHNAIMGSQWVTNVERLMFNDGMVALDIHGNAGMAYRLYQAAFNRTPDLGGLGYQMTALDNGLHLVQVAGNFIASPEFQSKYGNLTNEQFVRQLYANVLHREAEVEGYGYHLNNLNNGFTRADLLVGFSESPENQAALIGVIQDGMSYAL